MNSQEYYAWIQLALTPYVGAESFVKLIHFFGSAERAVGASADQIKHCVSHKQILQNWDENRIKGKVAADAAIAWSQGDGCRLMLLGDEDFPIMLTEGLTPPPLLFLRGDPNLLAKPSVAIVGSRHATPQAMRIAHDFGKLMSAKKITVISGMASGIDTAAHHGALAGKSGGTIAVWGTGIDRIYPQSNKNLAYQIAEQGLIVSEFPLGTRPLAGNFPRRNRLIAALSCATLVVEAALESGSLITAKLAADMGREVMAVPGSIDNPQAKGCHKLIKDGAKLVESLDDIVQECPQLLQNTQISSYSIYSEHTGAGLAPDTVETVSTGQAEAFGNPVVDAAAESLLAAMGYDPVHPDSLSEKLGLNASEIYASLLEMELDGLVSPLPGGRYQRIGK